MRHDFIDKFSSLHSVIHRLDPRIKLILSFLFLVLVASAFDLRMLGIYFLMVIGLVVASRVPLHHYFKKWVIVTPLAALFAVFMYLSYLFEHRIDFTIHAFSRYYPILDTLALMISKIYISILIITLLVSTTRFNDLLWGLRKFKFPVIVTTLSRLVYTYIFVFIDELHRTLRAYKSRTPELRISRVRVYGNITAAILLRSMDRSEYIYKAMTSRGFDGEFPDGNSNCMKRIDFYAVLIFLVFILITGLTVGR